MDHFLHELSDMILKHWKSEQVTVIRQAANAVIRIEISHSDHQTVTIFTFNSEDISICCQSLEPNLVERSISQWMYIVRMHSGELILIKMNGSGRRLDQQNPYITVINQILEAFQN